MIINNLKREVVPVAYVTKGKLRLKQQNKSVYLNDGDEFEIELFNPTTFKILAKIELNGTSIGSGIVLRPGERVYLERYLDESKKFLFDTYNVEGEKSEVMDAIKKNGNVNVKFFTEHVNYYNGAISCGTTTISSPQYPTWTNENSLHSTSGNIGTYYSGKNSTLSTGLGDMKMSFFNSSVNEPSIGLESNSKSVETGRVEKGSSSNQSFTYDNSSFNWFSSWESNWDILPVSRKVLTKEDLKVFCGECGSKRKKDSHKFCPHCGSKF